MKGFPATLPAAALLAALPAPAALVITVGSHDLQPNQAGQQVSLHVGNTGGALDYGGLNFSVRIGDGTAGPALTAVDLLSGTPLAAPDNFGGQFPDSGNTSWKQFWSVASTTATLPAGDSLLVTLTFDTTGLSDGAWALSLFGTGMPATQLLDRSGGEFAVALQNGTLTVVPEPGALAGAAGAALLAFGLARLIPAPARRGAACAPARARGRRRSPP